MLTVKAKRPEHERYAQILERQLNRAWLPMSQRLLAIAAAPEYGGLVLFNPEIADLDLSPVELDALLGYPLGTGGQNDD